MILLQWMGLGRTGRRGAHAQLPARMEPPCGPVFVPIHHQHMAGNTVKALTRNLLHVQIRRPAQVSVTSF